MKTQYNYLKFVKTADKPKTSIWVCVNHGNELLGEVHWYSSWRQYCYFPAETSVYSIGCLQDIVHFVEQLNAEHKTQRAKENL